ncbi:MAG: hypothetical protein R2749_31345 [Acidimicrobiales bacterium]
MARVEASEGSLIDTYLHRQEGRGVIVVIEATGVDQDAARAGPALRLRQAQVPQP